MMSDQLSVRNGGPESYIPQVTESNAQPNELGWGPLPSQAGDETPALPGTNLNSKLCESMQQRA